MNISFKFKYLLFTFMFLLFGCTERKLQGSWNLRLHDYQESSITKPIQEARKPFLNWTFEDEFLKIDGELRAYDYKNDSIIVYIEDSFRIFIIESIDDKSLLLSSKDYTPGAFSFYYFLK